MSDSEKYRFYFENLSTGVGGEISTAESHHAMHVLRLGVGAEVELFDGYGRRAPARIVSAKHGRVSVELISPAQVLPRSLPAVHLAFAVPKGKRLDWLLEKATELGAASLQPIIFERSVAGGEDLAGNKRDRWVGHCVAAAKQCGLDYLPEIYEPVRLTDFISAVDRGGAVAAKVRLFGDLSDQALTLPQALSGWQMDQPVLVLVGPEGGLTPAEVQALHAAQFKSIQLGRTVLRIETAALAMLAGVLAQQ